ncbi:MAG: vanadium-dependent haloperoxidase [Ideonella sp.]|nr:vanadium-dependent haloperoxidase [Ideonella sp.]MCC7457130.1 vanadium-dependent haloperoxidase [Nitrospira sp.]
MKRSMMRTVAALSAALLLLPAAVPAQQGAVTQWHAHAQTLVAGFTGRGNAAQAYTMALIQIAVYDATVAVRGAQGQRVPAPFYPGLVAPLGADLNAAVATAAFRVGDERVNKNDAARARFRNAYETTLAAIADGKAKVDGIAVGEAAAKAVLAARANDNFYNTATYANPAATVGVWQAAAAANPSTTAGANDYAMAFTLPLTASTPGARRIKPPPRLGSGRYARDFDETKTLGALASATRTPAMTDVVQFWTESGFTLWARNARNIVIARGLDELEAARALAVFSVATGDAMLACFDAKYAHLFWRPWQAIQRAGEDNDPRTQADAAWTPTVRANHPEYPAGHGCYSGSATRALRLLFGDFAVTLTSSGAQVAGWPAATSAHFDSLDDINDANADARVWGGLHWRTTMERSARWTARIAQDAVCGRFGLACDKGRFDVDD